jgi:hypothetical protein
MINDRRLMWILWPSFLTACALELFVFAFIDPDSLELLGRPLEWPRNTVYSVSFFMFWLVTGASSALTTLLSQSPFEKNRCPFDHDNRPTACSKDGV